MKKLRTLAMILGFVLPGLLKAQSTDYVTGFGFYTLPDKLTPLKDDKWLAVCTTNPCPGSLYKDTVFAIVFNSEGEVLFKKQLQLPLSESYYVWSATGIPDGGFAILVSRDLCDAGVDRSLLVFDSDGTLRWSKHLDIFTGTLNISPDGYLVNIPHNGTGMVAYNIADGTEAWRAELKTGNSFSSGIYEFEFREGGQILQAVGWPTLQRFEKLDDTTYNLVNSKYINPPFFADKIIKNPVDSINYTFRSGFSKLYSFNPISLNFTLIADYPFRLFDIVSTPTGLIALTDNEFNSFLFRIDFDGAILDTMKTFPAFLRGQKLSIQKSTLALAGIYGSGPAFNSQGYNLNARQLWLHINHLNGDFTPLDENASITQVAQSTSVKVDSFYNNLSGAYHYIFSGGQFSIEVRNLSETLLESVDLNIGFEWTRYDICNFRPAKNIHYAGLELLPGQSKWLEFGDIEAFDQPGFPTQLCFWTSAPNHKPDAAPENDIFCKSIYTVQTNEPGTAPFSISPNPANDFLKITFQEIPGEVSWKMYDLMGRQIKTGIFIPEDAEISINTAELIPGFYILILNGMSVKVLVEHFN